MAGAAVAGAKTKIDADITALQSDVSAATARLRKSTEKALG